MFRSFFPMPVVFFSSVVVWTAVAMTAWFLGINNPEGIPTYLSGFVPESVAGERPPFLTEQRLWTYLYILITGFIFPAIWFFIQRNKWYIWSVFGSTVIILTTYFNVQISVYLNDWYRDFYDLIQQALTEPDTVTLADFYGQLSTVAWILTVTIIVLVLLDFFVSHYVFRWRTAMNDYYMENWPRLRHIEGAAQRVQEDTMRFARIVEGLGVSFVRSLMTLIAFLPLLWVLSENVTELPIFGPVERSLVYVAVGSALFGTVLLAVVGFKLPGLEFNNQKVEAAYRKELVYGEDRADRAQPMSAAELFAAVRRNYFRLYFHYLYFGIARWTYLQASVFIPIVALGPTIVAGGITFGLFTQITNAFERVEESFKFLANSWTTIIDLLSIHKRLIAFEAIIHRGDDDIGVASGTWSKSG